MEHLNLGVTLNVGLMYHDTCTRHDIAPFATCTKRTGIMRDDPGTPPCFRPMTEFACCGSAGQTVDPAGGRSSSAEILPTLVSHGVNSHWHKVQCCISSAWPVCWLILLGEAPAIDVTAGCRQALGLSVSFSCLSGRQMLAERCMAHMYVCV
jgi:hypothetical protein